MSPTVVSPNVAPQQESSISAHDLHGSQLSLATSTALPKLDVSSIEEAGRITGFHRSDTLHESSPHQEIGRESVVSKDELPQVLEWLREQVLFYHGTATSILPSIREHGLDPTRLPYDRADWEVFSAAKEIVTESPPPFSKDRVGDRVFVTGIRGNAALFQLPEAINIMHRDIPELLESTKLSEELRQALEQVRMKVAAIAENASSVVLEITGAALDYIHPSHSDGKTGLAYLHEVFDWADRIGLVKDGKVAAHDLIDLITFRDFGVEMPATKIPASAIRMEK